MDGHGYFKPLDHIKSFNFTFVKLIMIFINLNQILESWVDFMLVKKLILVNF
jgi:hypothetical protein